MIRSTPTLVAFVLLALSIPTPASAGVMGGPVRKVSTVQGFHVVSIRLEFRPGESATVSVVGDGDTDLSMAVFDPSGKVVASEMRPLARCQLRWMPREGGVYQIKIANRGGVPNRFVFRTN